MKQTEIDKQNRLIKYAKRFGPKVFVETGTYRGDTVKAMLLSGLFAEIHSIEIYEDRAKRAEKRFASFGNIHCWHGDSGELLPGILSKIDKPILFWLDAHHSGKQIARVKGLIETPIAAELKAVLNHRPDDVILIDDARYYVEFSKKYPNYPSLDELERMVKAKYPEWMFEVKDDIIRVHHADNEKAR